MGNISYAGPESNGNKGHSCDGPGALGGPGSSGKGPQGALRGPMKGCRKEATQERAVKAKKSAVCVLEKEENIKI
jgi:hypothetical protein